MADAAFLLLAGDEAPAVVLVHDACVVGVERMQPVVVKVVDAAAFQLLVEDALQVVTAVDQPAWHLTRNRVPLTRIALDHGLPEGALAGTAMIGVGCVEVGETAFHKQVHHLLRPLDVDACGVVGVGQWQTH